jgi:bifunctional DNA-binding transcriptional regulator/antitoxin component of YhaV-PrlF toxin-antitoxin module
LPSLTAHSGGLRAAGPNDRGLREEHQRKGGRQQAGANNGGLRGLNHPLNAIFAAYDILIEGNITEQPMPKAHIRNGELTIPLSDEIREKLNVREGEELHAHILEDGLIVTRTSPEARLRAGERLFEIIDRVRLRPGQKPLTEEEIVKEVHAVRRARRVRQQHD